QILKSNQSEMPHASVWNTKIRPSRAMNPATPNAATPLPIFVALVVTSAFASSISSRTRREAFCDTSPTISPSDFSAVSGGFIPFSLISASQALEDLCEEERAREGAEHHELGTALVGARRLLGLARGGPAAVLAGG